MSVDCCVFKLVPQSVKIDINIERDLAYALKVRECPQILFLRGNKVLYREKGQNFAFCYIPFLFVQIFLLNLNQHICLSIYSFADFRTADELVQMIAFFYYKAKKPLWINDKALSRPF